MFVDESEKLFTNVVFYRFVERRVEPNNVSFSLSLLSFRLLVLEAGCVESTFRERLTIIALHLFELVGA